jgi:hypothetical protein
MARPIIGVARSDYFDYPGWLRDAGLWMADACFVQIGANVKQAIPIAAGSRMKFASELWKREYAGVSVRCLAPGLAISVVYGVQPPAIGQRSGTVELEQQAGARRFHCNLFCAGKRSLKTKGPENRTPKLASSENNCATQSPRSCQTVDYARLNQKNP